MTAGKYNDWTIEEGSKFSETVKWPGISSATGYSARMDIRTAQSKTATLILALTVANGRVTLSSDGANLVIALTISAADTKDLNFNLGYYDLEIIPPTGEAGTWRALKGTIGYSTEVTAA